MENFRKLILFNTIEHFTKENPNGVTHSDILEIDPHIPRTRISRITMKLTTDGYLQEKEIKNEIGRPTKFYSLTEKGITYHRELQDSLGIAGELTKLHLKHILKGRFDPISRILSNNETIEEKKEQLLEIKEDLEIKLNRVISALKDLNTNK